MRKYKSRSRETLIEQRNQNSLTNLLKNEGLTLEQKQQLVKERNPFLHIFGDRLVAQGGRSYMEFINHLYLGEAIKQENTL